MDSSPEDSNFLDLLAISAPKEIGLYRQPLQTAENNIV